MFTKFPVSLHQSSLKFSSLGGNLMLVTFEHENEFPIVVISESSANIIDVNLQLAPKSSTKPETV